MDIESENFWADSENGALLLSYGPLVRSVARRYSGRGAEYEDLIQEGYLALMSLIPKCRDRSWLPLFLKNHLPGYVRAAAGRLRKSVPLCTVALEDVEEVLSEDKSAFQRGECELYDLLRGALTDEELDITQALMEGFSQKEIGEALGVTQQAVSARVRCIRDKLAPFVRG